MISRICEECGNVFKRFPCYFKKRAGRFCSKRCELCWNSREWKRNNPIRGIDNSGYKNPMWGKFKNDLEGRSRKDGYIRVRFNGERILKHRFLMEEHLGRKLKKWEIIHHIDGNNRNNCLDNLQIMSQSEHRNIHFERGDLR